MSSKRLYEAMQLFDRAFKNAINTVRPGKAYYIGTQKGMDDIPDFDLFNVEAPGHPLHQSTIDRETAIRERFEVIEARYFQTMDGKHEEAFREIEEER